LEIHEIEHGICFGVVVDVIDIFDLVSKTALGDALVYSQKKREREK